MNKIKNNIRDLMGCQMTTGDNIITSYDVSSIMNTSQGLTPSDMQLHFNSVSGDKLHIDLVGTTSAEMELIHKIKVLF